MKGKLLLLTALAAVSFAVRAETERSTPGAEAEPEEAALLEKDDGEPILWGFGNYGFYSGYMLYGSIVNTEPTLQGYIEVNARLPFKVGPLDDLGSLGVGYWNNSDLTGKRNASYRRAFNENDPNVHWCKTFWFDDARTWGLDYRTAVVWYYYPHTGHRPNTKTTMDWNHSFALRNPYVIPFLDVVHEYEQTDANLLQFGLRRPFQVLDGLTIEPSATFVWRNRKYGWCFSNFGRDANGETLGSSLATMRLQLDVTYMFTDNIGVFAKVAYCQNLDPDLRDACSDVCGNPERNPRGDIYGRYNEFCWGGVGLCIAF